MGRKTMSQKLDTGHPAIVNSETTFTPSFQVPPVIQASVPRHLSNEVGVPSRYGEFRIRRRPACAGFALPRSEYVFIQRFEVRL